MIALDNRGHGKSQKFYDGDAYHLTNMAGDAIGLLDHLGINRCDIIGYSMGARICTYIAMQWSERVRRVILGGVGDKMIGRTHDWSLVIEGLLAPSIDESRDVLVRSFRAFAEQTNSDLKALAACLGGAVYQFSVADFCKISAQTMIVTGTQDDIAGSGERLAKLLSNACFLPLEGCNHMRAVGNKTFINSAIKFLQDD